MDNPGNLAFWKSDFEILAFLNAQNLAFSVLFFNQKGLGSGKRLSELHIHYKSLLTIVYYDHEGYRE